MNTSKNIEKALKDKIDKKEVEKADWSKIKAFSDLYSDAFRLLIQKAN